MVATYKLVSQEFLFFYFLHLHLGAIFKPCSLGRGGLGMDQGSAGENGTVTGKDCPKGLYGTFCKVNFIFMGLFGGGLLFC